MFVTNLESTRSGRPVANQFVISDKGHSYFQSYRSLIADIDHNANTVTIYPKWDYSVTTAKYFAVFLREYGLDDLAGAANVRKAIAAGEIATKYTTWKVIAANE